MEFQIINDLNRAYFCHIIEFKFKLLIINYTLKSRKNVYINKKTRKTGQQFI